MPGQKVDPLHRLEKVASNKTGKLNHKKNKGFATTNKFPHKKHPAYFRKTGEDEIEYVTFTHSDIVNLINEKNVPTRRLDVSVDYKNKGDNKYSHVVERVYMGKRSSLGKGTNQYKLDKKDIDKVKDVFENATRRIVPKKNK